jgi:hypothetical protein
MSFLKNILFLKLPLAITIVGAFIIQPESLCATHLNCADLVV